MTILGVTGSEVNVSLSPKEAKLMIKSRLSNQLCLSSLKQLEMLAELQVASSTLYFHDERVLIDKIIKTLS